MRPRNLIKLIWVALVSAGVAWLINEHPQAPSKLVAGAEALAVLTLILVPVWAIDVVADSRCPKQSNGGPRIAEDDKRLLSALAELDRRLNANEQHTPADRQLARAPHVPAIDFSSGGGEWTHELTALVERAPANSPQSSISEERHGRRETLLAALASAGKS